MKWFYDLKIASKLILGFVLVALIAGFIGIYGAYQMKVLDKSDTELYEKYTVPLGEVSTIATLFQRVRVESRDIMLANTSEEISDIIKVIDEYRKGIDEYSVKVEKTILSDEFRTLFNKFSDLRKQYGKDLDKLYELTRANRDQEALDFTKTEMSITTNAQRELIDQMVAEKVSDAEKKSLQNTKDANSVISTMITVVVIGMIIALALGIFISRIISKPIKSASEMLQEMKDGKLDKRLNMTTKDEVGVMASAMDTFADDLQNRVVETINKIANGDTSMKIKSKSSEDEITPALILLLDNLNEFISQMKNMSKEHDLGDIDVVIEENKFEGAYKEMAQGVNNMVNGHITVKKKAMACLGEIGRGNFDAEIETFPGKKVFINEAIEALRDNLKNVSKEVRVLINASADGKLEVRGNADKFTGDWADLIKGLNGLIDKIVEPVFEALDVLEEMSKGNLKASVKGDYKGDHAKIKDSLNFTLKTIGGYIDEMSEILSKMANGNLNVGIKRDYLGDFVEIKDSLNNIADSLNEVMSEINESAEQVTAGSGQVAGSAQALSQGSTEQASAIEELTTSMSEISEQTKQNAVNANKANELSISAKQNAEKGNIQMNQMLGSMTEINESSQNISKIIKVIDEIAFQTNILALNAAVEAARAGQHGKGFAVVAEEVRNLAARSANAAKETTDLIEGSVKKVEDGTRIANDTAKALEEIVDGVTKATEIVADIAEASNEQASAIGQVNQGINQVSQVTQSNSATAEESAAASEELSGQAVQLKELVSKFELKRNQGSKKSNVKSYNNLSKDSLDLLKDDSFDKRQQAQYDETQVISGDFGKY